MRHALTLSGGPIFDGRALHDGLAARFEDGVFAGFVPDANAGSDGTHRDLNGAILSPGYVDLQVNGGGGVMLNDAPSVATLTRIAGAHRQLGTTRLLPTLITDTAEQTQAAIDAAISALAGGTPGILGVHLEGPHLSVARKGAHDAAYIRPMEPDDLQILLRAKASLPILKVTIAPESVSLDQVRAMSEAGILVSLGHSDADFQTCQAYVSAGARCVTHLFNAMSQLRNREPGLVGAALASGEVSAGLIADGIHVHPATIRLAWTAKSGPGRIFLVSDAMAVAGTDLTSFRLDGRDITRQNGRLQLADGTLAGADLTLTRAIEVLVNDFGIPLDQALAAATSGPAELCGLQDRGLHAGQSRLDQMICIAPDLSGAAPVI